MKSRDIFRRRRIARPSFASTSARRGFSFESIRFKERTISSRLTISRLRYRAPFSVSRARFRVPLFLPYPLTSPLRPIPRPLQRSGSNVKNLAERNGSTRVDEENSHSWESDVINLQIRETHTYTWTRACIPRAPGDTALWITRETDGFTSAMRNFELISRPRPGEPRGVSEEREKKKKGRRAKKSLKISPEI